jgi:hypothetical protein
LPDQVETLPRLVSRFRIDALRRRVNAAGGFATILAHGDDAAGAIAVVTREAGVERALAAVLGANGYEFAEMAREDGVTAWISRARGRDPDLWVIELDIPQAEQFVAEILSSG